MLLDRFGPRRTMSGLLVVAEEIHAFVAPFPAGIHGHPEGSPGEHWPTAIPAKSENVHRLAATRHSDGKIRLRNPGDMIGSGA